MAQKFSKGGQLSIQSYVNGVYKDVMVLNYEVVHEDPTSFEYEILTKPIKATKENMFHLNWFATSEQRNHVTITLKKRKGYVRMRIKEN